MNELKTLNELNEIDESNDSELLRWGIQHSLFEAEDVDRKRARRLTLVKILKSKLTLAMDSQLTREDIAELKEVAFSAMRNKNPIVVGADEPIISSFPIAKICQDLININVESGKNECQVCKRKFIGLRSTKKYHHPNCRAKAYYLRKKAKKGTKNEKS